MIFKIERLNVTSIFSLFEKRKPYLREMPNFEKNMSRPSIFFCRNVDSVFNSFGSLTLGFSFN